MAFVSIEYCVFKNIVINVSEERDRLATCSFDIFPKRCDKWQRIEVVHTLTFEPRGSGCVVVET